MKVGTDIESKTGVWSFEDASDTFVEHIENSVPLYNEGHRLLCLLSDFYLPAEATILDVGCSAGNLALKLMSRHQHKMIRYVGVDAVEAMVGVAKQNIKGKRFSDNVEFHHLVFPDELEVDFLVASSVNLVVSYYTLQFMQSDQRAAAVKKAYELLRPDGAMVVFEKVISDNAIIQDMFTQTYSEFKMENGFSEKEIMSKTQSLKSVMKSRDDSYILRELYAAGFSSVNQVFSWMNFRGYLAVK